MSNQLSRVSLLEPKTKSDFSATSFIYYCYSTLNTRSNSDLKTNMKNQIQLPYAIAVVLVLTTTSLADVYDRCILVDDNTVIVKLKGGTSIKLRRDGQDIYLQQKSDDGGRWLSSINDPTAFRMILKFVKMGKFSGCRKRIFSPRKQAVIKKPRKLFRNAWFF